MVTCVMAKGIQLGLDNLALREGIDMGVPDTLVGDWARAFDDLERKHGDLAKAARYVGMPERTMYALKERDNPTLKSLYIVASALDMSLAEFTREYRIGTPTAQVKEALVSKAG